ncbi:hypothetical protein C8J56DRAFT_922195 [Mycena floridula]|nr:hypothetical protein C8J56DRAFT_922195 [Mycena floridula]
MSVASPVVVTEMTSPFPVTNTCAFRRPYTSFILPQSSIDRIPNELWSMIFEFAVERDGAIQRVEPCSLPLTISHVSRRWRKIALATGSLWTDIILTFPTSPAQQTKAATWISRSRTYPLDIYLDFRDPDWTWDDDEHTHAFRWQDMEIVLRFLLPHVKRWRRFDLLTDTWSPIFTFLWYSKQVISAPKLENLRLSRCNAFFADKNVVFLPSHLKRPVSFFGGIEFEALRHVSLVGVHVDWPQSALHNLLSLELKYHAKEVMPTLQTFVHIIKSCPSLETLTILGWGPRFDIGNPQDDDKTAQLQYSIILPRLTKLSFGFIDVEYAIRLLSMFSLPALQHLSLEDISKSLSSTDLLDAAPILDWLVSASTTRSRCDHAAEQQCDCGAAVFPLARVSKLELRGIHMSTEAFQRFFSAAASVEDLSLFENTSGAFKALGPSSGPDDDMRLSLPLLHRLTCSGTDRALGHAVMMERAKLVKLPFSEPTKAVGR